MIESNRTICKHCLQLKVRTEDGKFPNSKNKRYMDDNGKLWNGKTCPDCHQKKAKKAMQSYRLEKKK